MQVVVFASGGGNNFRTALETAAASDGRIKIALLITDRLGIRALDIAQAHNVTAIARDFEKECGVWSKCKDDPEKRAAYISAAEHFHDSILDEIRAFEHTAGTPMDLAVLSYHRLIQGKLLTHFENRMINQHPADLTVMREDSPTKRKYIGLSPVFDALRDGATQTRTTNFLVRDGCDSGEILCSGPWVRYEGPHPVTRESARIHEDRQKVLSDSPCLTFVLNGIASGRYGISSALHEDGTHVLTYNDAPLPYEGVAL